MTTSSDNSKQPERLYDFFDPDLWLARGDGMVWLLRVTHDAIAGTLATLDGLSVRKCARLLKQVGLGDFEELVTQLEASAPGVTYDQLIAQIKDAQQNVDLDFDLLAGYLASLITDRKAPLSPKQPSWACDFDFEVTQLINLRTLCITYIYFFTDMRQHIQTALDTHRKAGTRPPLPVIRECYRHLSNDFEIMQRAILQRQPILDDKGNWVAGVLAKELVITDKLAMKALAPFRHLLPNPTILTYFSQETHIRHLPFSDQFILVALSHARITATFNEQMKPQADTSEKAPLPTFELLAIPHEIGHYIYDHGKVTVTDPAPEPTPETGDTPSPVTRTVTFAELSNQFQANEYFHWCEELFADLYGCVVAGPLTVLGIQAHLAADSEDRLWIDDGEHPTSVVRPFIMSEMLRVLAAKEAEKQSSAAPAEDNAPAPRYRFAQAADSLDANWAEVLTWWGIEVIDGDKTQAAPLPRPAQIRLPGQPGSPPQKALDVERVISAVRPILAEFATHLLANIALPQEPSTGDALSMAVPWAQDDHATLKQYDRDMTAITSSAFATAPVTDHSLMGMNAWNDAWRGIFQGSNADEKLRHCLDNWGDHGPGTIGGH